MPRLVRALALLCAVGASTPAFACRTGGLGIQLGHVFFGFTKNRPCPAQVVVAQPLPPVAYYTQPQVVVAPPPPVIYSAPPMVYAQPAPVVVQQRVAVPEPERPGFLAFKYMPGASAAITVDPAFASLDDLAFAHSPGIELRLTRWLSLRSDLEFRKTGRTWDMLGVKASLLPMSPIKPYASVSFSGNESYANPGKYSFGFAAAAGLDIFIGKYFFIEAEARYRMTPGACCSEVPTVAGLVGGGVAFF